MRAADADHILEQDRLAENGPIVDARAAIAVPASAHFQVEWAVDLVLLLASQSAPSTSAECSVRRAARRARSARCGGIRRRSRARWRAGTPRCRRSWRGAVPSRPRWSAQARDAVERVWTAQQSAFRLRLSPAPVCPVSCRIPKLCRVELYVRSGAARPARPWAVRVLSSAPRWGARAAGTRVAPCAASAPGRCGLRAVVRSTLTQAHSCQRWEVQAFRPAFTCALAVARPREQR